jgi:hypothetical protein
VRSAVALIAALAVVAGCALLPTDRAGGAADPTGCAALKFPERRCQAVVARARQEAAIGGLVVTGFRVLPRTSDNSARLGGQMIARVRFDFADGSNVVQEVWCVGVGSGDDLACQDDPQIMLSGGVDHDVPCGAVPGGEPGSHCATLPPTPPPAAVAAARPLRVGVLDIPLDHLGKYEIEVGEAGLPNGYLSRREFKLADSRPTNFWIQGGILLDIRPTIHGRPPIGSIYRDGFKGTEPVAVFLVFDVTETSPGSVLQVRDLVVE